MPRFNPIMPVLNPAAIKFYRIIVQGELFGQSTENSFYYISTPASGTPDDLNDVFVSCWDTGFKTAYLAAISNDWNLVQVRTEELSNPSRQPQLNNYAPGLVTGAYVGVADPSFLAAGFRRKTPLRGQRGSGWVRVPGVPVLGVLGNGWTVAYKAILNTLGTNMLVPRTSALNPARSYHPALIRHKFLGGLWLDNGEELTEVDTLFVPSTQRSRRPRPIT